MKLLELLKREEAASPYKLMLWAAIAGLSNSAVLGIINAGAAQVSKNVHSFQAVALFAATVSIYMVAQYYVMRDTTAEVESILHKIRVRLAKMILRCDLLTMENIGRSDIYASITKETSTISQTASILAIGVQAGILIIFTSLYIAYLSLTAFVVSALFVTLAVSIHFRKRQDLKRSYHVTLMTENQLFDSLTDILNGFKEIKVNRARGDDLLKVLEKISHSTTDLKVETQSHMAKHFIFSQVTFLILLATIVFVVPRLTSIDSETVVQLTSSVLFLIGPISSLVSTIPVLASANTAAENIFELEAAIAAHAKDVVEVDCDFSDFEEIRFENVVFKYPDKPGTTPFVVGPINITIKAREVLFIIGGNGSGKSTFMKLLTGLYFPSKGTIWVDRMPLDETTYEGYRKLFSVIFSDYHLFKRIYGLGNIDKDRIEELLAEMELEGKTRLTDDNEFQTIELSAGQKKRVALLVSILEDKSIYVFDEWAADQDPIFRRKFYLELIKQLKDNGKTVIAVTHDDKYFGCSNRTVKMTEGRISEFKVDTDGALVE